jgi:peptidoglycan-associated lipoprotein
MNRVFLITLSSLALFFVGCSKKMPVALPSHTSATDANAINGDVVPTDAINAGSLGGADAKNSFKEGAVNGNGKYTGSDGVSKSGYKMLYFASDSYTLESDQIKRLMSDLPALKAKASAGKLLVEGNCDEFGTDEYNHALGLKRAKAVKTLLVNGGIDAAKIDTVSYGESNPTCTIDKPACHAKNRRAEINNL